MGNAHYLSDYDNPGTAKKYQEFLKKYHVQETLKDPGPLLVNPFVFEGKTVLVVATFKEMLTAADGLFYFSGRANDYFVVSSIPKGLFTDQREITLAAKVLGKTAIDFPVAGKTKVPHLKYIALYSSKAI